MMTTGKNDVRIYVDRTSQQWIVLDPDGNLWSLPSTDKPWDDRQPYTRIEEVELDPVPGHYKYILGIPIHSKASA